MAIKAILIDMGGVAHTRVNAPFRRDLAVKKEIELDELASAWSETRGAYLVGDEDEEQFWEHFLDKTSIDEPYEVLIPELMELYRVFVAKNEGFFKALDEIKEKYEDLLFVVASNKGKQIAEYITQELELKKYFKKLIFSHEIGAIKPDKAFFEKALEKLKLEAEECLFVDDKQENIDAAKTVGMKTILFTDVKTFKEKVMDALKSK